MSYLQKDQRHGSGSAGQPLWPAGKLSTNYLKSARFASALQSRTAFHPAKYQLSDFLALSIVGHSLKNLFKKAYRTNEMLWIRTEDRVQNTED